VDRKEAEWEGGKDAVSWRKINGRTKKKGGKRSRDETFTK